MRKNKRKKVWTDDTPMPWGDHRGKQLKDVPTDYFLDLLQKNWIHDWPQLKIYILANREQPEEEQDDEGSEPRTFQDYLDNR